MEIQADRLVQIIGEQKVENTLLMDRAMALTNKIEGLEKEIAELKKETDPPGMGRNAVPEKSTK